MAEENLFLCKRLGQRPKRWPNVMPMTTDNDYTRCPPNVGSMLVQRLRRWPNFAERLGEWLVSYEY